VKWILGDDKSIRFWKDSWNDNSSLAPLFLDLYKLTWSHHSGLCTQSGSVDNTWSWKLVLRRAVSSLEKDNKAKLLQLLENWSVYAKTTTNIPGS